MEGNLVQVKANFDPVTKDGLDDNVTILIQGIGLIHWAADRGHIDVISFLLTSGCDINLQDGSGQTALHYGALVENREICSLLAGLGARMDIKCSDGLTVLDMKTSKEIKNILCK
jgi:ankyrin repeat protein